MAQVTDYTVSNQTFPNTRADINNIFAAIATNNSGTSAPSNQQAGQWWIDTTSTTWTLYIHDGTDDIQFATIDTSANTVNFTDSALDVVTDTTPQLGGDLDLNSNDITGTGNINITGNATVSGNLDVDGGTIKLDGNHPDGTDNVALGNDALASITSGSSMVAIGKDALQFNTSGGNNVAVGMRALEANTTANDNVAVGQLALLSNQTGANNTALGNQALEANTASDNTAVGYQALTANTTGGNNAALGRVALKANTTGSANVAIGDNTLSSNTTGSGNVAIGYESGKSGNSTGLTAIGYHSGRLWTGTHNWGDTFVGYASGDAVTTGKDNTFVGGFAGSATTTADGNSFFGAAAGQANTTGANNTGLGHLALYSNTTASNNTAVGYQALTANTSGTRNVAVGVNALDANTIRNDNVAIGYASLTASDSDGNTAVGSYTLEDTTTGKENVAVGYQALTNNTASSQNVAIGYESQLTNTTGGSNTSVGFQSLRANSTGTDNTAIGREALEVATGGSNTALGKGAGSLITTGAKNTIIGKYDGNQGGLDIRTSSNNIVLADGDGNVRLHNKNGVTLITTNYSELANDTTHNIHQSTGTSTLRIQNSSSGTPYGVFMNFDQASPDNTAQYFLNCSDSTTGRCYIYSDGDLQNHDNSYGGISDAKLKEQIKDSSSQWEDIKALQVKKFKFKSDVETKGDSDDLWRLGLIAQEAELVSPSLVKTNQDFDADNNPILDDEGNPTYTKALKYSVLYMKAIKALQEAMQKIEDLEARVNTLEGN